MTISEQVRQELAEAPATARELADTLETSLERIKTGLWVLRKQGHLRVVGAVPNPETGRGKPHQLQLYGLTLRGETQARMTKKRLGAEE